MQVGHYIEHTFFFMDRCIDDTRLPTFRDIVNDIGPPFFYASTGYPWAKGINRNSHLWLFAANDAQGSLKSFGFLFFRHFQCARSCREGSDINHSAAFLNNLVGTTGYLMLRHHSTALKEGVGRSIQYSHDDGLVQAHQPASDIDGLHLLHRVTLGNGSYLRANIVIFFQSALFFMRKKTIRLKKLSYGLYRLSMFITHW